MQYSWTEENICIPYHITMKKDYFFPEEKENILKASM